MNYYQLKSLNVNEDNKNYWDTGDKIGLEGKLSSLISVIKYSSLSIDRYSTIHDLCCDVWENIFEYFDITDLFFTFASVTFPSDQVLFNASNRFFLRGLTVNAHTKNLLERFPINRVVSITLYEGCSHQVIERCLELRSLKLIGTVGWVKIVAKNISHTNMKLDQLTVVTSMIRSLPELIMNVLSIPSLRRLEIHADEIGKNVQVSSLPVIDSKIEQFIIDSGCVVNWNDLSSNLPELTSIRLLNIGLIDRYQKSISSFAFQKVHTVNLRLLETSFNWIIQLVAGMPCLTKLKLSGLVNADGFVVNQRWISIFESSATLLRIFVDIFLAQNEELYDREKFHAPLKVLNLSLIADDDDDSDCALYSENINRWCYLKGTISRPSS